ncbi:MAG: Hsp20/alpha crystallin family protein [Fusobacteriaceae bacterium]
MQLTKKNDWFSGFISDVFEDNKALESFKRNTLPAVNISEDSKEYLVEVCAPGIAKEDMKVKIEDEFLSISFKSESKKEQNEKKYSKKEYSYSSFERKTAIPKNVLHDQITANFENGILAIKLPKKEMPPENSKEIPIG